MNIKLNLKNDQYVIISKGKHYGFELEVFTPVTNPEAKKTHSRREYFLSNLRQVSEKLVWLGMEGDTIAILRQDIKKLTQHLANQLEKLQEAA